MDSRRQQTELTTFLVEGYWPGAGAETFSDATRRLGDSVAELRRDGFHVQPVSATLVPSEDAAYWIVDGPSAEIVALAYARAGVAVDRIVGAIELRQSRRGRAVASIGRPARRPGRETRRTR
jgi:hypothetical protein